MDAIRYEQLYLVFGYFYGCGCILQYSKDVLYYLDGVRNMGMTTVLEQYSGLITQTICSLLCPLRHSQYLQYKLLMFCVEHLWSYEI